jgi:PEP-CTERM motif
VRIFKSAMLGLAMISGLATGIQAADVVYDFNGNVGSAVPFTLTDATTGTAATFTGFNGTGTPQFTVNNQYAFPGMTGGYIYEPNGDDANYPGLNVKFAVLEIQFNKAVSNFFANFAETDYASDPLRFRTYLGGTQLTEALGTFTQNPVAGSQVGAGTLGYADSPFDRIQIESIGSSEYFALDNVSVDSVVPEPATVSLLAFGAVGVLAGAIRRRKKTVAPAPTV